MKNLFEKWKTRIPKYSETHKYLFTSLSQKFGAEGEKKINLGKHFSTNYELYIYAFFLGLYNNEFAPIPDGEKKADFSHHIQHWGSKTTISARKDFTNLQENIFIALIAKTDIDLVALEKGELDEDDAVKALIRTMESYTNGGLILISEKLEENPNYFLQPTSFLDMILNSNIRKSKNEIIDVTKPTSLEDQNIELEPLNRFILAQKSNYEIALKEVKEGQKKSHWMWYIFPQIAGLGTSENSKYYAISNLDEAKEYLNHEVLGVRIREISNELLNLKIIASEFFGSPDYLKLHSCMTLFLFAESNSDNIFRDVINKYFDGKIDNTTIDLIKKSRNKILK